MAISKPNTIHGRGENSDPLYGHTVNKGNGPSHRYIRPSFTESEDHRSSIIADHLAEQVGVDVWVPDYFNGVSHRCSLWCSGWLMSKPVPLRKAPSRRK